MNLDLIKAGTENFNLPHDVVPLPSGGIFYKNKKKSVKVGYLTASDENIILGGISNPNVNVVMTLIRAKLYENDIKPEEMLEGDVEAILIYLRNTSFGPEYTLTLTDPVTNKPFETTIVLDELNIIKPKVNPDENGFFNVKLPRSEANVKIKPLTYGEIIEIDKMVESYPQNMVAPRVTWKLQKQIVEINGETDKEKLSQMISNLPIMDSKFIKNFIKENEPSLDLKRIVRAPSGEQVNLEVTFGVEFFRPFF
jgi:hypothetical protein